jgi:hypothetical protein
MGFCRSWCRVRGDTTSQRIGGRGVSTEGRWVHSQWLRDTMGSAEDADVDDDSVSSRSGRGGEEKTW